MSLIDREKLYSDLQNHYEVRNPEQNATMDEAVMIVMKQPTADSVVHGHWIAEVDPYGEISAWHCSECYERTGHFVHSTSDYCPKCGAKMDEETEGEDDRNG